MVPNPYGDKSDTTKRATIMADDGPDRKVRGHRARTVLNTGKACGYPDAVNDLLARGA